MCTMAISMHGRHCKAVVSVCSPSIVSDWLLSVIGVSLRLGEEGFVSEAAIIGQCGGSSVVVDTGTEAT